jgi:hypothetical protein
VGGDRGADLLGEACRDPLELRGDGITSRRADTGRAGAQRARPDAERLATRDRRVHEELEGAPPLDLLGGEQAAASLGEIREDCRPLAPADAIADRGAHAHASAAPLLRPAVQRVDDQGPERRRVDRPPHHRLDSRTVEGRAQGAGVLVADRDLAGWVGFGLQVQRQQLIGRGDHQVPVRLAVALSQGASPLDEARAEPGQEIAHIAELSVVNEEAHRR